ncbi:MAG TPA: hypothetical protein VGG27_12845 [Magnetospirillaceae bacterium]|jgi:hypothetical protein
MTAPNEAQLEALRARLAGTNIDPNSLLATDYLNHFNEVVMMFDLVPDMPEMIDDAKAWKPLSYCDHFRASQFAERDLAVEAYGALADERRLSFEDAIAQTHARVAAGLGELSEVIAAGGDATRLRNQAMEISRDLQRLIERVSIIIHGGMPALEQPDIDGMFPSVESGGAPRSSQDDIDALFS